MSQERTVPPAGTNGGTWSPGSDSERAAVRLQMERILGHDLFKHSRRYPALFRYIVERTLEDATDRLKERTLGIEVFGREADYDTNLDPVVRTTAGEIRKRIAQYYHEPGHAAEIRIDLPVGSYVPEFQLPAELESAVPTALPERTGGGWARPCRRRVDRSLPPGLFGSWSWASRSPLDRFWSPLLVSKSSVLICVGHPRAGPLSSFNPEAEDEVPLTGDPGGRVRNAEPERRTLGRDDPLPSVRLPADERTKSYRIQGSAFTSLTNLREGPVILVGAFTNPWTMKLAARFGIRSRGAPPGISAGSRTGSIRRCGSGPWTGRSPTWRTQKTTQ